MEDLKKNHMEGQLSERTITRTITRTIRRIFDEDALSVELKMALWDDEVTEKRIFSKV
ncbi:hypothetical protein RvY_16544 [Ramazzottius varieornatus]|uniref:Uncharacterized protein n=1 Tax=Ramazzottius varieornatus TaxID=947166 RepID=A0A1D1W361_RAMVA|nr:hypothetical protein RvY_16544 [Ramazzottius varieornatus]